jgi:hypothetical protein
MERQLYGATNQVKGIKLIFKLDAATEAILTNNIAIVLLSFHMQNIFDVGDISIMWPWFNTQHSAHQRIDVNVPELRTRVVSFEGRTVRNEERVHIQPAVVVTMVAL